MDRLAPFDPDDGGVPPLLGRTGRTAEEDERAELAAFVREQGRQARLIGVQARILERLLERAQRGR